MASRVALVMPATLLGSSNSGEYWAQLLNVATAVTYTAIQTVSPGQIAYWTGVPSGRYQLYVGPTSTGPFTAVPNADGILVTQYDSTGYLTISNGMTIITGDSANITAGRLNLLGASTYSTAFRNDTQIELRNTGPGLSLFQITAPGTLANEGFVIWGAYDAGSNIFKTASISSKWQTATSNAGVGMIRYNAAGAVAGVATDDVAMRQFFQNGIMIFGVNDTTVPGLRVFQVGGQVFITGNLSTPPADYVGVLAQAGTLGGVYRARVKDLSGAKLFEFVHDFTTNTAQITLQSDTSAIYTATRAGQITFNTGPVIVQGGFRTSGDPTAGGAGTFGVTGTTGIGNAANANLISPGLGTGSGPATLTVADWIKVYDGATTRWLPMFS